MKKFKVFKSNGKSEIVEANRVEWERKSDGLLVKLFNGNKVAAKFKGVVCLVEVSNKLIISAIKPENENQDDD
jgi:hypothetical protein